MATKKELTEDNVLSEQETIEKEWAKFLSDSNNRKNAAELAHQITEEMKGKWFSVNDLIEVFKVESTEIARRLEVLMRFNMCVGQVKNKVPVFKIDLDHKIQRELLNELITEKTVELQKLKEKLSKLD